MVELVETLRVVGDLDLDTVGEFEHDVAVLLEQSSVVVDLSGLDFLAIASLPALLECQRRASVHARSLVYRDPPVQARRLLELSGVGGSLTLSATA